MKFLVAGLSVVLFLAAAGWLHTIAFHKQPPCVPFAQTVIPDENDGNWVKIGPTIRRFQSGDFEPYRVESYYEHAKKKGLKLGVHKYYGQPAFKAWACNNSNRPVDSDHPEDREDHMVAVLKEGKWYSAYTQRPKLTKTDSGVEIKLYGPDGKLVVEHAINRPH